MRGNTKNVNLLEAYNYKPKDFNKYKSLGLIAVPVILLLVMLGGYFGISTSTAKLEAEVATLREYTQKQEIVDEFAAVANLQVELQTRQSMLNAAESYRDQVEAMPALYMDDFNQIQKSAPKIYFDGFAFSAETGILEVQGKVIDYNAIPKFIIALKQRGIFSDVEYYGYALGDDEEEENIDYRYGFIATCYVKAVKSNG